MEKIIVDGGYPLSGKVEISGMKNAAVAVIFASVVASGVCVIDNLPCISDVSDALDILKQEERLMFDFSANCNAWVMTLCRLRATAVLSSATR